MKLVVIVYSVLILLISIVGSSTAVNFRNNQESKGFYSCCIPEFGDNCCCIGESGDQISSFAGLICVDFKGCELPGFTC